MERGKRPGISEDLSAATAVKEACGGEEGARITCCTSAKVQMLTQKLEEQDSSSLDLPMVKCPGRAGMYLIYCSSVPNTLLTKQLLAARAAGIRSRVSRRTAINLLITLLASLVKSTNTDAEMTAAPELICSPRSLDVLCRRGRARRATVPDLRVLYMYTHARAHIHTHTHISGGDAARGQMWFEENERQRTHTLKRILKERRLLAGSQSFTAPSSSSAGLAGECVCVCVCVCV
jgi:hypothetical protein